MKPGFKTTEFYFSLIAMIVGILLTLGVITPDQSSIVSEGGAQIVESSKIIYGEVEKIIGAAMSIAAVFGYSMSRGIAKQGAAK